MKNLFLMLAFMLVGNFAFGNTAEVKYEINFVESQKKEIVKDIVFNHHCSVEDGHFVGEGTGRTARQACRRARRDLRRQARESAIQQ